MQQVFEEFASRTGRRDPEMVALLDKVRRDKRENILRTLSKTESENLYDVIELAAELDRE